MGAKNDSDIVISLLKAYLIPLNHGLTSTKRTYDDRLGEGPFNHMQTEKKYSSNCALA